jgi:17beta-estradiol 17-dehydrogenase / very-long-chain 3-oxoacyl-CoA reductase
MHQLDDRTTYGILQVNVEGTVRTTRAVVPFLINQRRGAIINVSSGSGNHPTPMISCYASTKVFIY